MAEELNNSVVIFDEDEEIKEAIFHLVLYGELEEAQSKIIQYPHMVSKKDNDGRSLIHLAVISQSLAMVKYCLEAGNSVNSKDKSGLTPLQIALILDHANIAKYLIEHGANVHYVAAMMDGSDSEEEFLGFDNKGQ